MPHFQISSEPGKEAKILSTDVPQSIRSEDERRAETMRQRQAEREAERYGTLISRPLPQDKNMITEETRRHLEARELEKASVPNVLTTHSDIAKVAKGTSDIALVPTVNVYTKDDPLEEGPKMTVEDRTVTLGGVLQGETVLDRAESSIPQPVGDEYSRKSATGPTLPEGVVTASATVDVEEGETEPAFDVEASPSDRLEQRIEESGAAAAEAAKVAEKQDEASGANDLKEQAQKEQAAARKGEPAPEPKKAARKTTTPAKSLKGKGGKK